MRSIPLLLVLVHAWAGSMAQPLQVLRYSSSVKVDLPEPSDLEVVPESNGQHFWVVSDNGHVAEIDRSGSIVRINEHIAYDLEAVCRMGDALLVIDERTRRIIELDPATLDVRRRVSIAYDGGRNKGFEAAVWNPVKERLLLITERDPVLVFELDRDLRVVNEMEFDRSIRDISAATWHDGHVWLLSDMDRLVLKCDPLDLGILERFSVPVINPEGLAFDGQGNLLILSDDRQRLYTFPFPPARAN